MARVLDRAWDRYDDLGELQRIGLGVATALLLAATALYCFGAASLIVLSRTPSTALADAPSRPSTPLATLLPIATDVPPVSPLLADRTPTLRPTGTPPSLAPPATVTATAGRTPTAAARGTPSPTLRPASGAPQGVNTPTRTPTPTPVRAFR